MVTTTVVMTSLLRKPIGFDLRQMAGYAYKKGNREFARICEAALETHAVSFRFDVKKYIGSDEKVRKYLTLTLEFLELREMYDFLKRYATIVSQMQ